MVVRFDFGYEPKTDYFTSIGKLAEDIKLDKILESHVINYDNSLVVSSLSNWLFL